jgi:hypothetical protein
MERARSGGASKRERGKEKDGRDPGDGGRRGTRRAAELAEAGASRGFHVVGPKVSARRHPVWTEYFLNTLSSGLRLIVTIRLFSLNPYI